MWSGSIHIVQVTKLVKKITQYVINFTRTTSNCTKTLSDKICQTTQTTFLLRERIYHSKKNLAGRGTYRCVAIFSELHRVCQENHKVAAGGLGAQVSIKHSYLRKNTCCA